MFSSSLKIILQNSILYASPCMAFDTQHMSLRGVVTLDSSVSLTIKRLYLKFRGELSTLFPAAIRKTHHNIIGLIYTLKPLKSDFGKITYTLKAVAETTFLLANLKSKVPVYIHHYHDALEELSAAYTLEQTLPNKVACKITLSTDVYSPSDMFVMEVLVIALDPTVNVTNVTCSLKEYTHFRIPSKSDPNRLSVAEFMKTFGVSSTPFTADANIRTFLITIPKYTASNRVHSMVEVTHKVVVHIDLRNDNGEKDVITLYVPIIMVAAVSTLEFEQLPFYSVVESPPSYHISSRPVDEEVTRSSPPPSYGHH
ncbi:hypothetical protein K7432_010467 [Basidiobolus ranarum]|uniref:Arrestin C-terminal-like domain-containing protein n=1 Tax=Basidiobolus ranarum TaxID=34480 RepID=A0ABR2WNT6_9FUNG